MLNGEGESIGELEGALEGSSQSPVRGHGREEAHLGVGQRARHQGTECGPHRGGQAVHTQRFSSGGGHRVVFLRSKGQHCGMDSGLSGRCGDHGGRGNLVFLLLREEPRCGLEPL